MEQPKILLLYIFAQKYENLTIAGFENNVEKQSKSHPQLLKVPVKPYLIMDSRQNDKVPTPYISEEYRKREIS